MANALSANLFEQTADVTVANSASELTLVGAGLGSMTLPANFLVVGRKLRLTAMGSWGDTLNPTLRVKVKAGSTILLDTGANAIAANVTAPRGWWLEAVLTCRSTGASGSLMGQGFIIYATAHTTAAVDDFTPTAAVTVATTGTLALDVTAQWGTGDPANSITCTNLALETW